MHDANQNRPSENVLHGAKAFPFSMASILLATAIFAITLAWKRSSLLRPSTLAVWTAYSLNLFVWTNTIVLVIRRWRTQRFVTRYLLFSIVCFVSTWVAPGIVRFLIARLGTPNSTLDDSMISAYATFWIMAFGLWGVIVAVFERRDAWETRSGSINTDWKVRVPICGGSLLITLIVAASFYLYIFSIDGLSANSFKETLLGFVAIFPIFLVCSHGIWLAFSRRRKHPTVSRFAFWGLLGMYGAYVLMAVFYTILALLTDIDYISQETSRMSARLGSIFVLILFAFCWWAMMVAVFSGREFSRSGSKENKTLRFN